VGAVRIGARSFYEIGPGATVLFRANYLAAPKFSGGGHAGFSIDLGLGLDVRLAGRLHGTAGYTFQRINRKTNPGGTGEIDVPVQATVARVGVALALSATGHRHPSITPRGRLPAVRLANAAIILLATATELHFSPDFSAAA